MQTTSLKCKNCKAPLEFTYVGDMPILKCTRCGFEEKIDETDPVTIERIRASVELGKKNIEKESTDAARQYEIEKQKQTWKRIRTIAIIVAVLVVFGLIYASHIKRVHKDDIKMPLGAEMYCGRNYQDTIDLLVDAGFLNVEEGVIADLSKSDASLDGIVSQVSINGDTTFSSGTRFPNTSRVRVTYHTIDPAKANQLEVPLSSDNCIGQNYSTVVSEFTDAGFTVETDAQADLTRADEEQFGKVTSILIGNRPEFKAGDWIGDGIVVSIVYHVLDPERATDILIPGDEEIYIGQNYVGVCEEFESAGFLVETDEHADLTMDKVSDDGKVTQISVNGQKNFEAGVWVPANSTVTVVYHILNPERATDIQIPDDPEQYLDQNYLWVYNRFENAGFTGAVLNPIYDRNILDRSDPGLVESVVLNGSGIFTKGKWVPFDSSVVISYHADKPKYIGEAYLDVESLLKEMGFRNISLNPLDDLDPGDKKADEVTSVTVDGDELSEAETFSRDSEVVISFHTERELTETRIAVTSSSGDLSGEDYQDVVQTLQDMGFTNVTAIGLEDVVKVTGWLITDGAVKSVSIDGRTKFDIGTVFESDAEVIVSYHSMKQG